MSEKSQYNPNTGMTQLTESHRSPEYKSNRDSFVETVNRFLVELSVMQENEETIEAQSGLHFPILREPRVTESRMGVNAIGFGTLVVETSPGISLHGDGATSPRELQAVLPDGTKIMISGTNPMLPVDQDTGEYLRRSRSDGNFAIVEIEQPIKSEDEISIAKYRYSVLGDGSAHATDDASVDVSIPYDKRVPVGMQAGVQVINELAQSWGVNLESPSNN